MGKVPKLHAFTFSPLESLGSTKWGRSGPQAYHPINLLDQGDRGRKVSCQLIDMKYTERARGLGSTRNDETHVS